LWANQEIRINMTKNMTRKGLAFGAGVALVASGLAALPAQAAGTVTLSPSAGTSYNTLSSSTFTLMPVLAGVGADEYKYLRYKVTNTDEATFRVDIKQDSNDDGELSFQAGTSSTRASGPSATTVSYSIVDSSDTAAIVLATGAGLGFTTGDSVFFSGIDAGAVDVVDGVYVVTVSSDTLTIDVAAGLADQATVSDTNGIVRNQSVVNDDSFVVLPDDLSGGSNRNIIGSQNYLALSPSALSTTSVATVQAWIDANGNNTIDAGETVSAAQTVTFKPVGTLSATVAVDPIYAAANGAGAVTSELTFTGDINYRQITAGQVTSTLSATTDAGTSLGAGSGSLGATNYAFDTVTGRYVAAHVTLDGVTSADVLLVTAKVDNDYNGSVSETKATKSATIATTVATPTFEASVTNSATAVSSQSSRSDTGSGDVVDFATRTGAASVVEGSTGFEVKMFLGTDAIVALGVASAPIAVTVTSTNVSATDAVTVGGKALVTGTTTTVNVTTNATGYATIPVSLGAADDNDTIVFNFNPYGADLASSDLTVTVTDNEGDFNLTQLLPGNPSIEVGDTFSIEYRAVDLFGVAPKNNTHTLLVAASASSRTKAAVWSYSIPVVDGKATLTVTDNGTGTGTYTAAAKLVLNGTTGAINSEVNVVINVVADSTPAKVTAKALAYGTAQANDANNDGDFLDTGDTNNTGALLLSTKAFSNYDSRYNLPTVAAPEVLDTYKVTVGGTVTNAAGTAVAGAPVTFAATGFLFSNGTEYKMDSITVHANALGVASVDVWSSVGGARSVTMTSGAVTASQALVYAAGTGTATGFTISAPASSEPGKTVDVKVTATDKFGNPAKSVTVTFYSTGPGYLINTTGTTLSDGTFSTKLLLGTNDSGTALIRAVVTIDGVETIKTASIAVGTRVTDASALPAGAVVNVGTFNGKIVVYAKGMKGSSITWKIAGKWEKAEVTKDYQFFDRPTAALGLDVMVDIHLAGNKTPVFSTTVTTK
jgi:hypothetical protein